MKIVFLVGLFFAGFNVGLNTVAVVYPKGFPPHVSGSVVDIGWTFVLALFLGALILADDSV